MTRSRELAKILTDGNLTGTLDVAGVLTGASLDISGNIDIDGTTNLDVTDIDGTLNVQGETTLQTHLNLSDGGQIKLGNGSDLRIFHDGNNSYIDDVATGDLYIRSNKIRLQKYFGENYLVGSEDGSVSLYYDNVKKFETTSSGVTVTGSILTTNIYGANDGNTGIQFEGSDVLTFHSGGQENIQLSSNAIVFNQDSIDMDFRIESNNKTNVFFVDAGNDRIGIGTDTPSYLLDMLESGSGDAAIQIKTTTGGDPTLIFNSAQANRSGIIKYQDNGTNIGRIQYNHSGDRIDIQAGSSTGATMSILNGKVGIGTTTPGSFGSITSDLVVGTTSGEHGMTIASGTGNSGRLQFADNTASPFRGAIEYAHSSDDLMFYTAGSQRMRIKSDGKVGINESSPDAMLHIVNGYPNTAIKTESNTTNGHWAIEFHNSNGRVGNIMTIGSATQFNVSSDYRLKENVKYDFDATSRLKQLKPARFNFIADADTTVDGFIAHEVSSIVPEAISGEKDAVDGDGKAVMQGIDQSKLVPLLVKTLQEALTEIDTLKTKVAALEGS